MKGTLVIVGLGPGSPELISAGALEHLKQAPHLWLRTEVHPLTRMLRSLGLVFRSFDYLYETAGDFDQVYDGIVAELLGQLDQEGQVTYAVPGHPLVAEESVRRLLDMSTKSGRQVRIIPSMSCLDAVYASLHLDPCRGVAAHDALEVRDARVDTRVGNLFAQVYNRLTASDLKLKLMNRYPDDHPITLVRAAGVSGEERLRTLPLHRLDTVTWIDHLTSVYVPPLGPTSGNEREPDGRPVLPGQASHRRDTCNPNRENVFERLVALVRRLRSENGCPWDRCQTHESIRRYLVEEAYEVVDAIDSGDPGELREELGDLLLQIVFHAQMSQEQGLFDIDLVIEGLITKMIRRHPHVFSGAEAGDPETVLRRWEELKLREKQGLGEGPRSQGAASLFKGIPTHLPALTLAERVQSKTARVGFEWDSTEGAVQKVLEEFRELAHAWESSGKDAHEHEFGDLLFALVNVARYLKLDPEAALRKASRRFVRRFSYVEAKAAEENKSLSEMSLTEMDRLWEQAKALEDDH